MSSTYEDPLIDDVRERRRQVLADHDNDLRKLLETIRRRQAARPEQYSDLRKRKGSVPRP